MLCCRLLFIHAFTGCDTTSFPFSIGKSSAVKKCMTDIDFRDASSKFANASNLESVAKAGERAMICLYGGKTDNLDQLRFRKYKTKVGSQSKAVQPQSLPPTSASTRYHSMHQIEIWRNLVDPTERDATAFGWDLIGNILHPSYTDKPPTPDELLNVIVCKCSTDCSTLRCSCRKHGLNCSLACGSCQGDCCTNTPLYVSGTPAYDSDE